MNKRNDHATKLIILIIFLFIVSPYVEAQDIRMCGGYPERSWKTVKSFRDLYPCPSTALHVGSCPGWQVDHVIPLAVGGCDSIENLQWLPKVIKTGKKETCSKDRWERIVYSDNPQAIDWEGCY